MRGKLQKNFGEGMQKICLRLMEEMCTAISSKYSYTNPAKYIGIYSTIPSLW